MKIILKIQKDGVNTLKEEILSHSNSKLKKIYVIAGDIKESGYDIIEECLIDLKARKLIAFGVDKKNTTRKMLENVLKYTKNVYVWDNNSQVEFNSNILIFEYEDEAFVYLAQGSITDSMLETDMAMYTKISFDSIKDKREYEEYVDILLKEVKESFEKLTKEHIEELVDKKLIFTTKQYMHVLPSISELLGKTGQKDNTEDNVEVKPLPKIELNNEEFDAFEIDLGEMENLEQDIQISEASVTFESEATTTKDIVAEEYEQDEEIEAFGLNEEVDDKDAEEEYVISDEIIDMEALVLDSKVVKIDREDIKNSKKEKKTVVKEKQTSKKINLSKVSNIIMELASKPTKGKDLNKIKVPNYIKDMVPNFFEVMEDALVRKTDDGEYKEIGIKLEIIDVNNSNKFVDGEAKLRQKVGQTFIEFESDKLVDIMYEELDIARIIKLARDSYHIEIIPQGIEEYSLWDKLCTNNFRGSSRQYGLM